MAHFSIQLAGQCVVLDLEHDDVASVRDELLRTRYLIGTAVDAESGAPAQVLISATSIRWICCSGQDHASSAPHMTRFTTRFDNAQ
jgi:hypothetical protein